MPRFFQIPPHARIEANLSGLLSRTVKVSATKDRSLAGRTAQPKVLATYVNPEDALGAAWICGMAEACRFGAALALLPAAVADEASRAPRFEGELRDNFYEVMNVLGAEVTTPIWRALLKEVLAPHETRGEELRALVERPPHYQEYLVEVQGYGSGKLGIVLA